VEGRARGHHIVRPGCAGRIVSALELVVVRCGMVGPAERGQRLDQAVEAYRHKRRQRLPHAEPVEANGLESHVQRAVDLVELEPLCLRPLQRCFAARGPCVGPGRARQLERSIEEEQSFGPVRETAVAPRHDLQPNEAAFTLGYEDFVPVRLGYGQPVHGVLVVDRVVAPALHAACGLES
jgi:hypothetical protein